MHDGRWTFFIIINNILLAFHMLVLLMSLSALTRTAGMDIPFLFELYIILPPAAGIVNSLFNHSIIRRNYTAAVPLSDTKKGWQIFVTLLYVVAAAIVTVQLVSFLQVANEDGDDKDVKLINFLRIILFLYCVLSVYMILFQLIAARKAGSTPEESGAANEEEENTDEDAA